MRKVSQGSGERCSTHRRSSKKSPKSQDQLRGARLREVELWMSMPCTALELPDSSEQKVQIVERDDPPLHVERVEHPSIAGYSLQSFGPGQPLAARARWRRAFTPWMSASPVSQSEGATMWSILSVAFASVECRM